MDSSPGRDARPDLKEQYLPIVQHGVDFLSSVLWDKQYGGFSWGVDDNGQITPFYRDGKELYGISFGLYGAAAAYQGLMNTRTTRKTADTSNG